MLCDVQFDLGKALKSALGGGLSGAAGTLKNTWWKLHLTIQRNSHGPPSLNSDGKQHNAISNAKH